MNQMQWKTLDRLMAHFPANVIAADREMKLINLWILLYRGKREAVFEAAKQLGLLAQEEGLPAKGDQMYAELTTLLSWHHYDSEKFDLEACLSYSTYALKFLPKACAYQRGFAWVFWGAALQGMGRSEEAIKSIYDELGEPYNQAEKLNLILILNYIYLLEGQMPLLSSSADHLIRYAESQDSPEMLLTGKLFLGLSLYFQDKLEEALEALQAVFPYRYEVLGTHHVGLAYGLTLAHLENGDHAAAEEVLKALGKFVIDSGNSIYLLLHRSLTAELDWRSGRLAKAQRWAAQTRLDSLVLITEFYYHALTLIKILIYQQTPSSQERAGNLLVKTEKYFERRNNIRLLTEILALKAMLYFDREKEEEAFELLQRSIIISESCHTIRIYADLGPKMAHLLRTLIQQNFRIGYVSKLLAAFRRTEEALSGGLKKTKTGKRSALGIHLSKRELEVLNLLNSGINIREISEELYISYETVRKHTKNIYSKLQVNARSAAIKKAKALGLLSA